MALLIGRAVVCVAADWLIGSPGSAGSPGDPGDLGEGPGLPGRWARLSPALGLMTHSGWVGCFRVTFHF